MKKVNKVALVFVRCICFVIAVTLVLCGISAVLEKKPNPATFVKPEYTPVGMIQEERNNSVDVLALGNSDLWASFDPMFLWKKHGYTSLNGASPGQTTWEAYFYLMKALKTQIPKILILETDMIFPPNRLNKFSIDVEEAIVAGVETNVPLIANHNRWKSLFKKDVDHSKPSHEKAQTKGYNLQVMASPYDGKEYMTATDKKEKMPAVSKAFLDRIRSVCEKNEIDLLFYEAPTTNLWTTEKSNAVKEYAQKHGVDFFDFNLMKDAIGLDWATDTRDMGIHLNQSGAEKITGFLGKYLDNKKVLTNRKADKNFSHWNEAEKKYDEMVAQKIKEQQSSLN